MADKIVQKFVQYRLPVAIVGDISRHMQESVLLRDFVRESNRGGTIWFAPNFEEIDQRLRILTTSRR